MYLDLLCKWMYCYNNTCATYTQNIVCKILLRQYDLPVKSSNAQKQRYNELKQLKKETETLKDSSDSWSNAKSPQYEAHHESQMLLLDSE